jgi:hypothetical protein
MSVMALLKDTTSAAATARARLRQGATAVAAGRVLLGLAALARPSVPARPWVGASADDLAAQVFGRALGARDIALGLGALAALRQSRPASTGPASTGPASTGPASTGPAGPRSASAVACAWLAAGALSDGLDAAVTVAAWRQLPRTRWLIAASAGGAALVGAGGALALLPGRPAAG